METIDIHHDINAPADTVWAFLENYEDIQAWWPKDGPVDIDRVEIEGSGVGVIRHIYNHGMPNAVSERLDYLDPANKTLKLSIVCDKPAGLVQYQATGQVTVLNEHQCRLTYHSEYTVEPGYQDEARAFLLGAYQLMFTGLEQAAARTA